MPQRPDAASGPDDERPLHALLGLWDEWRARLVRRGVPGSDADDCMQETALRVLRAEQRGATLGGAGFVALLLRNARVDWLRRRGVRQTVLGGALDPDAHPVALPRDERRLDVEAALVRLPEAAREVVLLSTRDGLSYREIAERLGIPEGTVKSRMSRALATLRKDLLP